MQESEIIRMTNQIAKFFESYPLEKAIDGVEDHLRKFWDPRMKKEIISIFDNSPELLNSVVMQAVAKLKATS